MLSIIETTLGSSVADGATTTVNYPAGTNKGTFDGAFAHEVSVNGNRYRAPNGVLVAPGNSNITITNNTGATWAAGTFLRIGVDAVGSTNVLTETGITAKRVAEAQTIVINLGTPVAASANGISASQSVGAGANALLNGALAANGAVTLDVPRNVVAAWTGTSVVTVRGFDEYDQPMIESSASGTSFTGKKAFKRVTRVSFSAAVTLATVGTGTVLGLPVFLPGSGSIRNYLLDGANVAVQTTVGGDITNKPSATSGDVRGTVDFSSAPNGALTYRLYASVPDPVSIGQPPFNA